MNINLLVNEHRLDAIAAAKSTATFLKDRRAVVGTDRVGAALLDLVGIEDAEFGKADLVVSFGGDGTLIRASHLCSAHGTPVLGVYFGRFGFVTQCEPNEVGAALSLFFDGQAKIRERMMIETELIRGSNSVATLYSLNESVVQRAATTRMLDFEVSANDTFLVSYPADGVMISTPTGSTGYNLSAGGPIVDPALWCMTLTAITPHSLSTRPIVFSPETVIDIRLETRGDAVLSSDGQSRLSLLSGDQVRIRKSERVTRLVTIEENDFLSKISERLFWNRHGT